MKVCLATLTRGDQYDNWFVDNKLALIRDLFDDWIIKQHSSIDNFSNSRNELVAMAESKGYDWIFFMDADEMMFGKDVLRMLEVINEDTDDIIIQPRINFVSPNEIETLTTPDLQGRVFKLHVGYHYRAPIHETVFRDGDGFNWHTRMVLGKRFGYKASECPIYHYGWLKPQAELEKRYWRKGETTNVETFESSHPLTGEEIYAI